MPRFPALILFTFAGLAFAGCVSNDPAAVGDAEPLSAGTGESAPVLSLSARGCMEGGGHSVHPKGLWERKLVRVVPEPWVPADILDDVGPQLMYSEIPDPADPVPTKGRTMGNHHATLTCDAWLVNGEERTNLMFGWVGMRVERPEWSDDAPTHHYLVTVVATNDDDVYAALVAGGIHAMRATANVETMPGDVLRVRMSTDHNGDYDSIFKPKPFGEMKATHIRIWSQHENPDGTFTPIPIDLISTGGQHLVSEGQAYFSHVGTHHHGPLPGGWGQTAAMLHTGFDRVISLGAALEVSIPEAYDH